MILITVYISEKKEFINVKAVIVQSWWGGEDIGDLAYWRCLTSNLMVVFCFEKKIKTIFTIFVLVAGRIGIDIVYLD